MRSTDYGLKIGKALKAIMRMHSDTGKMLSDCDKLFPQSQSVYGNYVTRDLSWSINAQFWMAEGVYRYWSTSEDTLAGVTVIFTLYEQPLLAVARIKYNKQEDQELRDICDSWDIWNNVEWTNNSNEVRTVSPHDEDHIENMVYNMVELYSIESIDDVKELFESIGFHFDR